VTTKTTTALGLTTAAISVGLVAATPAAAGGIGDFLSPAFGTSCANQHTGAHATGTTHFGTGAAGGNLAGLPVGSPLNQCGGADLTPGVTKLLSDPDKVKDALMLDAWHF